MKNIYLYGASDDCHEVETDFNKDFESYNNIIMKYKKRETLIEYVYDGDFGIKFLEKDFPANWIVKEIHANAPSNYRVKPPIQYSQFIHIQIPDEDAQYVTFEELDED